MSNISITGINEQFPIQGQDNPSQGFRSNFSAIKNALSVAKTEITALENTAAKTNVDNNFNGKRIENAIFNNTSDLYKNKGQPTNQEISLDVKDAKVFKISCISSTTVRFTNWPQNSADNARCQSIKLHIKFDLADLTGNPKINFSTDIGGEIKSFTNNQSGAWKYINVMGGWHLVPWKEDSISNDYGSYEHVFEIWSYNSGLQVFIKYEGSFA